jgi:transposase
MSRFRQNDRERAVGIVQAGMSHQAVADHYNVSRITISRLMIRLRQTGRTNDIPHSGRPRVTSQSQDRHLRIIHLRDRMITAEETARRTPVLTNVRISGQTVRRRLRESGRRVRRPVVGLILMQPQRTARLAWACACRRWGLHTWQHILFSDESRILLRLTMDVIVCTTSVGNVLRTSVFTCSTVLEADVLWRGLELVMMVALSSKLLQEH